MAETYTTLPSGIQDREHAKFELDGDGHVRVRTTTTGTLTGEISPSGLKNGGRFTEVTIDDTTWTALPPTALTNRNAIGIQNRSGQAIKVGYDPLAAGYVGMEISDGEERQYDITDAIVIYAKSSTSSCSINVEEIS